MTRTLAVAAIALPLTLLAAGPADAQSRGRGRGTLDAPGLARLQRDTGAEVTIDPGTGTAKFVRVKREIGRAHV